MTGKDEKKNDEAVKADEKPQPLVGTDNPNGIDLSKGDKDAATAFEPEEK